uniref:Uncharacterized protein n=1 Tax=Arundo donax TaxID=35708 RepID=A0A0A9F393_ARUDO
MITFQDQVMSKERLRKIQARAFVYLSMITKSIYDSVNCCLMQSCHYSS